MTSHHFELVLLVLNLICVIVTYPLDCFHILKLCDSVAYPILPHLETLPGLGI